jgi:7-carboxy-7-deazaguanine synthase
MFNFQNPEPRELEPSGTLAVHSIFRTIQGEGPFTGKPAVFIRLAGCNLQCPGCDTDYTSARVAYSADRLVSAVQEKAFPNVKLIVITGGEPFRQNINVVCRKLIDLGFTVQVETNGTLAPQWGFPGDVKIVVSPKTNKIHHKLRNKVTGYKYVIDSAGYDPVTGLPVSVLGLETKQGVAKPLHPDKGPLPPVYIQPRDERDPERNAANLQVAIDSCMKFGHTLQLQLHKIIGVE